MHAITGANAIEKFAHQIIIKYYKKGKVCNDCKRIIIETKVSGDRKASAYISG